MKAIAPEFFIGTPLHDVYRNIAPRPEDFPTFVTRMQEAMSQDYDWTEAVSTLKTPTLVIAGDADSFPPTHAAELFTLLGGGQKDAGWDGAHLIPSQLAILPGTTHYNIIFHTDLLLPILSAFLDQQKDLTRS
ncbi:MAG TPA: alpha/beta hydrolase, partial [Ktedonobacteraceae bacterium]|nr:alpha/beta hydrolase [Ktedonobacteraceae bacterium]